MAGRRMRAAFSPVDRAVHPSQEERRTLFDNQTNDNTTLGFASSGESAQQAACLFPAIFPLVREDER
jgi:hypothetical protein